MNNLTKEEMILRTLKENPDLDYDMIKGLFEGWEEMIAGKVEKYEDYERKEDKN